MKRILLLLCLVSALLITSCGAATGGQADDGEETFEFTGQIDAIDGDGVLVLPNEGEAIRASSDKISFSCAELTDIGAEIGDFVTVTYSGAVAESYPAQIHALDWQMAEIALPRTVITHHFSHGTMKLSLSQHWQHESPTDGRLDFWSEAEPTLRFSLCYEEELFGVCATGVTTTELAMDNGTTATLYTEEYSDGGYWAVVFFGEDYPYYHLQSGDGVTAQQWSEFEEEILEIFRSISL